MEKMTKRNRSIGKAALFLAFLGPLGIIGIAFAVLDIISDKKKEYKHGLSIAAIIVSCLFIGYLVYALVTDLRFPDEIPTPTIDTMELPAPVEEEYVPADDSGENSEQNEPEEAIEDSSLIEEEEEFEIIIIDEEKNGEESEASESESIDETSDENVDESSDAAEDSDSVTLNIPKDFVTEASQEELDAVAYDRGYKKAKMNDDGSVTYVLSQSQHRELMQSVSQEIDARLSEMVGSDIYPSITSVESNSDYTNFIVKTKNKSLSPAESSSVIQIYMYGGMYAIFSGNKVENIHVDYVNDATGEVISSANSKDVGKDI